MDSVVTFGSTYVLGLPIFFWAFLFCIAGMFALLFYQKQQRDKAYWKENGLENAKPMVHKSGGLTPPFGMKAIVVSQHKWVIIEWNKHDNTLNIWEPTHTYKTPEEYKLGHGKINWKIYKEVPKNYTTVEQHFKRQVM